MIDALLNAPLRIELQVTGKTLAAASIDLLPAIICSDSSHTTRVELAPASPDTALPPNASATVSVAFMRDDDTGAEPKQKAPWSIVEPQDREVTTVMTLLPSPLDGVPAAMKAPSSAFSVRFTLGWAASSDGAAFPVADWRDGNAAWVPQRRLLVGRAAFTSLQEAILSDQAPFIEFARCESGGSGSLPACFVTNVGTPMAVACIRSAHK